MIYREKAKRAKRCGTRLRQSLGKKAKCNAYFDVFCNLRNLTVPYEKNKRESSGGGGKRLRPVGN